MKNYSLVGLMLLVVSVSHLLSGVDAFTASKNPCSSSSSSSLATTSHAQASSSAPTLLFASTSTDDATTVSKNDDTTDNDIDENRTPAGLLKRDRYIASNRFAVRPGKEAKFEQRWATRKSRLATLPGFKYFHLMRRVTLNEQQGEDGTITTTTTSYDGGDSNDERQGNYVSFTIWEKKSDFSAWRKGEAFKEAHGGTSLWAFVTTLVSSARTLQVGWCYIQTSLCVCVRERESS